MGHATTMGLTDTDVYALFYHDIIYNPLRGDNEEQSAKVARDRLQILHVREDVIRQCETMVMATKHHGMATHPSINVFLDADLAILGASPDDYHRYTINVRKEYKLVPNVLYKPGRKKVLQHFLSMPSIFKTPFFQEKLEAPARINIAQEIKDLSG
jgi:predicted metal-dependent HD superfamily phosphohydrolase